MQKVIDWKLLPTCSNISFIRRRRTKAEITALRLEQASQRTTVASVPVPSTLVEGPVGADMQIVVDPGI